MLSLKQKFPILSRTFYDKPLVYLDSAATTQKPQSVIDAISRYYSHGNANVHRGIYRLSEEATKAYEAGRSAVRALLNALKSEEIIFTKGTTESINLVATPPMVSIPKESGMTSRRRTSLTSPCKIPA